ncbi:YadA-like family protein, partial [Maricaulis sp.]|uniref:YadA-like family protein n=1 Tax=Maricaulis sp. TaxID=1486257 RepID=UPI0035115944
ALAIQTERNARGIRENTDGIAIANALAGSTWLQSNEAFALSANWGYYGGSNSLAISGAARIDRRMSANFGVGVGSDTGHVGARAGVRWGW